MRIRGKLITGYFMVALLTAVVGFFGINVTKIVNDEFVRFSEDETPLDQALQELKFAGLRIVTSTMEYGFLSRQGKEGRSGDELRKEKRVLAAGIRSYDNCLIRYEYLVRSHCKARGVKRSIGPIQNSGLELLNTSAAIVSSIDKNGTGTELGELKKKHEHAEQTFLQAVTSDYERNRRDFAVSKHLTNATMRDAKRNIEMLTISTFVLALLCGILVSASISRRLTRLELAAKKIGEGELETVIDIESNDELGSLANAFSRMVGDLKRSRDEIVAGKNYLNDIIHSMMDALIVVAPDGTVQSINGAACSMLGYDEEPVGEAFANILQESPFDELVEQGFLRNAEKTYLAKDGRSIPVAFSGSVMWNSDNTMRGIVCVAQDISERKQAEEMLRRYTEELRDNNEELKGFAYIVSHDMRAPLVNIKGFSRELLDVLQELDARLQGAQSLVEEGERDRINTILRNEVPEALDFINSSVHRMDVMIKAVLKLSQLGRRETRTEPVKTDELVYGILKTMQHQLERGKVTVTVGDLPDLVMDRTAMEQIVGNLLDNAVKYLEPGRPGKLEITAEQGDGKTTFHCRDNGRGISHEDMAKIFELFRRAGRQDTEGEGMGLAYVKTLLKRFGGRIWCESQPGEGSVFSFTIPMQGNLNGTS